MYPRLLIKAIAAMRKGRLGDAGAYKAVALTAPPYPEALRAVRALSTPFPNFVALLARSWPAGSLGSAFAEFIARHGITPLSISPEVQSEIAELNPVAARYVLVHDVFHVVLGFDVSRAGELAVWSFVGAQRYSPSYGRAAAFANVLYPILEPSARMELKRQRARGIDQARRMPCLIGVPLDSYWSRPLLEVRRELRALDAEPGLLDRANAVSGIVKIE